MRWFPIPTGQPRILIYCEIPIFENILTTYDQKSGGRNELMRASSGCEAASRAEADLTKKRVDP